jgi:hypothetical protein
MNTTASNPGVWSRSVALALGVGLSLSLIAMVREFWLLLFAKLAGGFLLTLLWVLVSAIFRRGFRWFFSRRALRFHGCAIAGVVSLIVLFYVEEGWRSKRAWAALQRELAARGGKLDLASVTPPPVPDDLNLAMAPVMARLLNYETNSSGEVRMGSGRSADAPSLGRLHASGRTLKLPEATWARQEFTDLAAWQTYFRLPYETSRWSVKSNRFVTKPAEPQFPVAAEAQTPARDVLLALSKFHSLLDELARAAAERPRARYPHAYELGYFGESSVHRTLKDVVRVLRLRAVARLHEGQVAAAFADVELALRLADSPREEPWLLSHIVLRHPMLTDALQPVWEGLARHQWTEPQLAALQRRLGGLDLLAEQSVALRGETAISMDLLRQFRQLATGRVNRLHPFRGEPPNAAERFWVFVVRRFYPLGWLYEDEVLTCRILRPFDTVAGSDERPQESYLSTIMDPFFVTFLVPKLEMDRERTVHDFPRLQTLVNQAVVGCALERYRLAHGEFPENLELLAPRFLSGVPRDVASGQPFRYRRTGDGRFVLYAIGSDGVDDGGRPAKVEFDWQGSLGGRSGPGDWVWSYPAPARRASEMEPR